jgi:hypothetical protein
MARSASRVSRVLMKGPLAPFAVAYELELKRRGHTPLTRMNQLCQVGRLSRLAAGEWVDGYAAQR